MTQYHFDSLSRFVIEDYDALPPFASFLPGIAGPLGIPLWAFYVNRGQAIASFGVESKDNPIMEFQPANKAYQMTPYTGFRTFIKATSPSARTAGDERYYEPFSAVAPAVPRRMCIAANELELEEASSALGLQVNTRYFILPGESFAGLVRQVTVKNIAARPLEIELLDGLPLIIPFGIDNGMLKAISRTAEAWMGVFNLDAGLPFYRVQASIGDSAEVKAIEAGHFYLAFADFSRCSEVGAGLAPARQGDREGAPLLPTIIDPTVIFGENTALSYPDRFLARPLAELLAEPQIAVGRTPCGMAGAAAHLAPGESLDLFAIIGHVSAVEVINRCRARLAQPDVIAAKRREAQALAVALTDPIATQSSDPRFDAYCRQALLDNILRGGWPVHLNGQVYHIYGRRHGDLERDYNAFYLPAEHYSQGNASYRDVNQNRRCDVLLNPAVGDSEVLAFLGLIQADGYNPLTVYGSRFTIPPERQATVLDLVDRPDSLRPLLDRASTIGQLLAAVARQNLRLAVSPEAFVGVVVAQADWEFAAEFGEGYWVDHWFYNLDLLDSYLAIYPDRKDELLFVKTVPYYQGAAFVQPRNRKSVLVEAGKVRQYGAVLEDEALAHRLADGPAPRHLARAAHGQGAIFHSTVFAKLTGLALLKFATLDPAGMGIEMEAGKPGWCDALNGLPGLFGSSLSETYELERLLDFLLDALAGAAGAAVALPVELADLLQQVVAQLTAFYAAFDDGRDHRYWDAVASAREAYRDRVRLGFDGRTESIELPVLAQILRIFRDKVAEGIAKAEALTGGIPPTYFTYEARDYEVIADAAGQPLSDPHGRAFVRVKRFEQQFLPPFLEGPMHALRSYAHAPSGVEAAAFMPSAGLIVEGEEPAKASIPDEPLNLQRARALYNHVKASPLFDAKLGMYKTNASLAACSHEIGRLRAFTPGWLENESVFLHLAYKYLLGVLRAGLNEEFFADMRRGLAPFLDPQVYGRSPLENSSFIVSSAHPDASLHGRGFVARLTGATAEFLNMWSLMMVGPQPFFMQDGELCLAFKPTLPAWLFRDDGTLTFTFLGNCTVTCRRCASGSEYARVTATTLELPADDQSAGRRISLPGDVIPAPYAAMVRSGAIKRIELCLE